MAKKDTEVSEIEFLTSELAAKDQILSNHQTKISKLETIVEKLQLDSQLGPTRELPPEIYAGVSPAQVYNGIIQGLTIGVIQTYGVSLEKARPQALAAKIAHFADLIFKEVLTNYMK